MVATWNKGGEIPSLCYLAWPRAEWFTCPDKGKQSYAAKIPSRVVTDSIWILPRETYPRLCPRVPSMQSPSQIAKAVLSQCDGTVDTLRRKIHKFPGNGERKAFLFLLNHIGSQQNLTLVIVHAFLNKRWGRNFIVVWSCSLLWIKSSKTTLLVKIIFKQGVWLCLFLVWVQNEERRHYVLSLCSSHRIRLITSYLCISKWIYSYWKSFSFYSQWSQIKWCFSPPDTTCHLTRWSNVGKTKHPGKLHPLDN